MPTNGNGNGSQEPIDQLNHLLGSLMGVTGRAHAGMNAISDGLRTALQVEYDRSKAITSLSDSDPMTLELACSIYMHHSLGVWLTARLRKLAGGEEATLLEMARYMHKAEMVRWRERIATLQANASSAR